MSPGRSTTGMEKRLDILHLSLHGLIRGHDLELGRDPDTGGQCLYVLELVKALARHERVERVTLVTRRVFDRKVGDDYAAEREDLGHGAEIRRIGPPDYVPHYMIQHGMGAFMPDKGDGLNAAFDGAMAWEQALTSYLHCPTGDAEA